MILAKPHLFSSFKQRYLGNYKQRVMLNSRLAKLDHFYSLCHDTSSVLDAGVSGYEDYNEQVNFFLNHFRLDPSQYTGLAIEPIDTISAKHPQKKFVQYPGDIFPFKDKQFDWVFSNAVIEHVGSEEDQVLFINEIVRVSKQAFITTPNKLFPVESHTDLLFLHWFNQPFYKWCKKHHSYYSKANLVLLSYRSLHRVLSLSNAKEYQIYPNKIFGLTMTFSVVIS